jgi:para-nitrobenzyl esterase
MTGGGQEAHDLAEKMSGAWINFAKTGNPNYKNLPEWPAYTSKNTATMHFDVDCKVNPQMDKELFELVKNN